MKNITEKSLLANLTISTWQARKYDRKATDEVNKAHNTEDAGRFNKVLVAKSHLEDINKTVTKLRQFHYDNTLPWSDNGDRLLAATNYFDYVNGMAALKSDFETAVKGLTANYPSMIEEAKQRLNGLFSENDYPKDIEEKFRVKTSFMPVPETGDIRVKLTDSEVETLKQTLEVEIGNRFTAAQNNIYERVVEKLKAMHARLIEKDSIFRDSLFTNILELVELLPKLNVLDDPNITTLCADLKKLYCEPDNVRKDQTLRADKAKEVEAMLNKVNSFFNPVV
jgi:hypothetical protein